MINIILTILAILVIIVLWVTIYDSNRFVVVKHTFSDKRIMKTARAVVITDLHNKCFGKNNELLLTAIREQKPDFILVGGDIPTAKPGKSLDIAISFLRELTKEYPVYYANGNHEHRMKLYPETYGDMWERYESSLKELGVKLLVNEKIELPECGLCIYGSEIEKKYYKRFKTAQMDDVYMESILGKRMDNCYNILLAHNPDYFPQYAAWGADLVLSGHVHGGMVRIPFWGKGVVSPKVSFFPEYDGGLFTRGDSVMLLGRGLGMHTIPVRTFNPGELIVVDFEPDRQEM